MKIVYWIIAIILMALISFKGILPISVTYRTNSDFGNDWTFIPRGHAIERKCDRRADAIKQS